MKKIKKIILTSLAVFLMPSTAFASLCPFSDRGSTKCEILLCVQQGFPSSGKCRPALREFIKRAFQRKSPIPFPTNCMCEWVPPIVIPTDKNGIPRFLEDHFPNIPNFTELEARQLMTRIDVQDQINSRTQNAINTQNSYRTNCDGNSLSGSSPNGTCFIQTENNRTDVEARTRVYWTGRGGFFNEDRVRHVETTYNISSVSLDEAGNRITNSTTMRILDNRMVYCRLFRNNIQVSDNSCGGIDLDEYSGEPDAYDINDYYDDYPNSPYTPGENEHLRKPQASSPEDDGIMVFE